MTRNLSSIDEIFKIINSLSERKIFLHQIMENRKLSVKYQILNYHLDENSSWILLSPVSREYNTDTDCPDQIVLFYILEESTYTMIVNFRKMDDPLKGTFFVDFPQEITRIQRRESYRVSPDPRKEIRVILFTGNDPLEGKLINISDSGMAVGFKHFNNISLDHVFDSIDFMLPEAGEVSLIGTVKYMEKKDLYTSGYPFTIGIKFDEDNRASLHNIRKYLVKRQMDIIKLKKRLI